MIRCQCLRKKCRRNVRPGILQLISNARQFLRIPEKSSKAQTLDDLSPVIELYHHTVMAGKLDKAARLYYQRLKDRLYFQFGAYEQIIDLLRALFLDGEDNPPRLKNKGYKAWALSELANAYSLSGQPRPLYHCMSNKMNCVGKPITRKTSLLAWEIWRLWDNFRSVLYVPPS